MEISLFGAVFMKISYGIDVQETNDPYIQLTEESLKGITAATIPGAFWVDFFPIMKYIPGWFPGAGFQKKAKYWSQINASMLQKPYAFVKEQLVRVFFFHFSERFMICGRRMEQLRHL